MFSFLRFAQKTEHKDSKSTALPKAKEEYMPTILVVDDSAVSQRLLTYTLQRNGYTVVTASDGCEALGVLANTEVDLVITDLEMPGMDGLTLLREMRADRRFQTLRMVMITASGQDQDRIDAQAGGVSDFLTKPSSSRDLLATVSRLLD